MILGPLTSDAKQLKAMSEVKCTMHTNRGCHPNHPLWLKRYYNTCKCVMRRKQQIKKINTFVKQNVKNLNIIALTLKIKSTPWKDLTVFDSVNVFLALQILEIRSFFEL